MEVTGQAFEDMQEQNMRLLQQLKEKDDANFKLMSEVMKQMIFDFTPKLMGLCQYEENCANFFNFICSFWSLFHEELKKNTFHFCTMLNLSNYN